MHFSVRNLNFGPCGKVKIAPEENSYMELLKVLRDPKGRILFIDFLQKEFAGVIFDVFDVIHDLF